MRVKISTVIWVFLWSLFMGVTAISIGFGAAFPPLNYVAAPFVCPGGTLSAEEQGYTVSPVESVTTITWYCIDGKTGEKAELSMWPMALSSGLIYGFLLFLVIFAVMVLRARRSASSWQRAEESGIGFGDDRPAPAAQVGAGRDNMQAWTAGALSEMEDLTQLRDSGKISEAEFRKRKQQLLSRMPR